MKISEFRSATNREGIEFTAEVHIADGYVHEEVHAFDPADRKGLGIVHLANFDERRLGLADRQGYADAMLSTIAHGYIVSRKRAA